jgi:hypothetical protein
MKEPRNRKTKNEPLGLVCDIIPLVTVLDLKFFESSDFFKVHRNREKKRNRLSVDIEDDKRGSLFSVGKQCRDLSRSNTINKHQSCTFGGRWTEWDASLSE